LVSPNVKEEDGNCELRGTNKWLARSGWAVKMLKEHKLELGKLMEQHRCCSLDEFAPHWELLRCSTFIPEGDIVIIAC
jgi:hypothetical protein